MAQTTEAACLLQSGAIYPCRIGLKTATGEVIFAGVKSGGVSIYFDDAPIYHFDLDGRWQRAFVEGIHYLKGLDAAVRSIDREREDGVMVLQRQTLPYGKAVDLDALIRSVALDLIDSLDAGRLEVLETPPQARSFTTEEFREFLERVAAWDSAAWFAHRERYLGTYGPMPFVPPHLPNALILQATLGHAGGVAFGRARAAEPYVRSVAEFEDHVRTVAKLVNRRISQHSQVFLAGADVFHQPRETVLAHFESIRRNLPVGSSTSSTGQVWDNYEVGIKSIHAFLDDFAGPLPDRATWIELASAHLAEVTIGIESGDLAIRSSYGRSWTDEALRSVVVNLLDAGIGVDLVILAGAGGRISSDSHVSATIALVDSLPLDRIKRITLIDARRLDHSPPDGFEPILEEELSAQVGWFKSKIGVGHPSKRPKIVVYNPDKQSS